MAAELYVSKHEAGTVKTKPAEFTPQELLEREQTSQTYDESWFSVYIPWHRTDEWWEAYAEQKLQMDAENLLLRPQPHRTLMLTIAAGALIAFALARL